MREDDGEKRVYSPDIQPYSFEGKSYFIGTIVSIVVAPIRIVTRIMHNIIVMPANLQRQYSQGLFIVAGLMTALGIVDFVWRQHWPLLVSQLPLFWVAYHLKRTAVRAEDVAEEQREIDIDHAQVEELINTVYDELDKILKE